MFTLSPLVTRDGGDLSILDLQKMVQALPQYTDQMENLSLHVEVCYLSVWVFRV